MTNPKTPLFLDSEKAPKLNAAFLALLGAIEDEPQPVGIVEVQMVRASGVQPRTAADIVREARVAGIVTVPMRGQKTVALTWAGRIALAAIGEVPSSSDR